MRSVRARCRSAAELPFLTAAMHCVLSSRQRSPTSRPRACEKRSTIGRASDFRPVAMEMYSASHVLDA
eukprot:9330614-Heterocapsa_arctica.AAC.1